MGTSGTNDKRDQRWSELKKRTLAALQKKVDDDITTMYNAIKSGDLEEVKVGR